MAKIDIKSMTLEEITLLLKEMGQPSFRAKQVYKWLQNGIKSFSDMTDISKQLRSQLEEKCYIADVIVERKLVSKIDRTVKYLYKLSDGNYIESVLMKYKTWYSVCASTQVGCRMGCKFCASGQNGFVRNLTASEILSQILFAEEDNGVKVSHVVLMGMGEPLDNFENVIRFIELVSSEDGLNISKRHISLSTSGLVPKIYKLGEYGYPITLSVSLHNPINEERSKIMPVNNSYNVNELMTACKDYIKKTGRRISFEYALISGVNDTSRHSRALADLLKGMLCHVNLIPANPIDESDFSRPDNKRIENFKCELIKLGINTTVRRTLGADINASCGQLRKRVQANN